MMDVDQIANKTTLFNSMLLRAWRERWTDSQWGINIKTILPRSVSGDVYNLADCIFQQAVVGSDANSLVLSYLRHSLCSRQVSHAAVLKRISRFDGFDRTYCLIALLDFLRSIIGGVTCRSASEAVQLPNAMLSLIYWLLQIFASILEQNSGKDTIDDQQEEILSQMVKLLQKISGDPYLFGTIHLAKQESAEQCKRLQQKYFEVKIGLENAKFTHSNQAAVAKLVENLQRQLVLPNKDELANGIESDDPEQNRIEPITYCLQPLIAVEVQCNPNCSTDAYVSKLLMIKQIKNYTTDRLYYEIIRAALASLCNVSGVSGTNRESLWYAFAFIKVPHILRQLHALNPSEVENLDYSPDIVAALEMLNEDPFLDFLDTKCECNTIEYLLSELAKHSLINEHHVQKFASARDSIMVSLAKKDLTIQQPPIIKLVKRAEPAFSGILKALDGEYSKMQEPLLEMLCQTLSGSGNSFELILSIAAVEGKLKTFVSRLIRCNESSKQVIGEVDKAAQNRSALFDVSFLMLAFIVQTYGSEVVLDENGDSFFEKWARDCMLERTKNKSPMNMVHQCEQSKIDEFLMTLNSIDKLKSSSLKWQDICMNIPGVLYHLVVAWENETISAAEVKTHLDSIKSRQCSFSVCAASWLCAYMQIVRDDLLLKPMNMVKQFLTIVTPEEVNQPENFKERLGLTIQIIRKMQNDAQKIRSLGQGAVSQQPLEDQFNDIWQSIAERGWLPIDATQILDSLLYTCGPYWLVSKLVSEILQCKFVADMKKTMDIVFAIMHLNIEKCTVALLAEVMPMLLIKKSQKYELVEPKLSNMARLCVSCIVSTLQQFSEGASKKRSHNLTYANGDINGRAAKMRKLDETNASVDTPQSNDEQNASSIEKCPEALQTALQHLFTLFTSIYLTDELTPNTFFVCKFFKILQVYGSNRIKPVLNLLPPKMIQSLLKSMSANSFNYGFILNLYDLSSEAGRCGAMTDITLFRSIQMQKADRIDMD